MIEINFENKIADVLNTLKRDFDIDKTQIASRIGVSPQALDDYCKVKNPGIKTLLKVSHACECEITSLFDYKIIEKR